MTDLTASEVTEIVNAVLLFFAVVGAYRLLRRSFF